MAAQLEELIVEREAAAEARDRRSRIRTTVALVVVALIAVAGVVLSIQGSAANARAENQRTADVAAALAKPVADKVLADGRAESAQAARGLLRSANSRLIASRLPIVPEPAPDALSAVVQVQASRALLLADLGTVDFIAEGFRDRFGESGTFPASFLDRLPAPGPAGESSDADGVVDVLPSGDGPTVVIRPPNGQSTGGATTPREPRSPGARPAPAPSRPAARPTPQPAPAPAPARRDRGLCLLGVVLCES